MMFLVLYFPTAFNMLRETGRPPSPGRLEGTVFSHAGRATKHCKKKRHLVIIKLFLATFQKWSAKTTNLCCLRFWVCVEVGPVCTMPDGSKAGDRHHQVDRQRPLVHL